MKIVFLSRQHRSNFFAIESGELIGKSIRVIILCYIIRREKMELSHKELNFCRSGDQSCTTPEQEFTCAVITIIELKYERSLILG